jgi:hypothetical protein
MKRSIYRRKALDDHFERQAEAVVPDFVVVSLRAPAILLALLLLALALFVWFVAKPVLFEQPAGNLPALQIDRMAEAAR